MHRLPLLLASAALCACPPGGGAVDFFRATPDTIAPGDSVQLDWQATGTEFCELEPGPGRVSSAGALVVTPAQTTRYELRCGNGLARKTVTVVSSVRILTFVATPPITIPDGVVQLAWTTDGATRCYLDPGNFDVLANDTRDVQVTASDTWTLTCEGRGGPVEANTDVTVTPVTTLDPPSNLAVTAGDGALTFTWDQSVGASNVYLAEEAGLDPATITTKRGGVVYSRVTSPFVVTGLVNGRPYFARATAASGTLESAASNEASGTPVAGAEVADPLAGDEWHLVNTGQRGGTAGEDIRATLAWADGRGEGVRVAVVDEGVDLLHLDLAPNAATLMSHDYLGNTPRRLAEHGTCVAGLIAARDLNGRGVRGVAPRANLVSYNLLQDLTSSHEYDAMTRGMAVNGASNNSWGDAEDGTGLLSDPDRLWLLGVQRGTSLGRGGKGVVYLWAAGNGADARTVDDANFDGQANSRFVFAIGGVGDDGKKADYAEAGANVLVAAPTGGRAFHALTTTDLPGAWGYNDGLVPGEQADPDYTNAMDGTSASTPVATGAVALVLAANPALTWRDVRRVLALTARKNDPLDGDWATNGAGLHVNHKYGFGVVDAQAAVTLAKGFSAGEPERSWTSPAIAPALPVPDADLAGVASWVDVAGSGVGHVEFVEVAVTLPHARTGDLELRLEKQGGTFDVLHPPHDCARDRATGREKCSDLAGYRFGSVRHLDEPGDGRWTLKVVDRTAGNTGVLESWTLTLTGRP